MKRHKSLIPLSQDHHNGLMLAQLIKKDAPEYKGLPTDTDGKVKYLMESWEEELKIHFRNEEKILFPSVKGKNAEIDKLIDELIEEHQKIKQKIEGLDAHENKIAHLDNLGKSLEQHIRKEERLLFQDLQTFCLNELEAISGKIITARKSCKL